MHHRKALRSWMCRISMTPLRLTVLLRVLALISSTACSTLCVYAECKTPHYREGVIWVDEDGMWIGSISMHQRDITPQNLICLAGTFRNRLRNYRHILVNIYTSHRFTSLQDMPVELTKEAVDGFAKLHGRYSFNENPENPQKSENFVEIIPLGSRNGMNSGRDSTRIDLPANETAHCKLEIQSRCLQAMRDFLYPLNAQKQRVAGTVALSANLLPSGKLKNVRLEKAESAKPEMAQLLAQDAVNAIASWQFAPGKGQIRIRLTISFTPDESLTYVEGIRVKWNLPEKIWITGGSPKSYE